MKENDIGTQVLEAAINIHWEMEIPKALRVSAPLRDEHPLKTAKNQKGRA
ncbi:MAG: hypothetical protein WCD79_18950 [Chthoniobacteraceae bacterium]